MNCLYEQLPVPLSYFNIKENIDSIFNYEIGKFDGYSYFSNQKPRSYEEEEEKFTNNSVEISRETAKISERKREKKRKIRINKRKMCDQLLKTQQFCCIFFCNNPCNRRMLRAIKNPDRPLKFKRIYEGIPKHEMNSFKICNTCYFKDYYRGKKKRQKELLKK